MLNPKRLRENPVVARRLQRGGWPSPRLTWILLAGLVIIGAGIAGGAFLLDPTFDSSVSLILPVSLSLLGLLVALLSAPIGALLTAFATARAVRDEGYQLLRVSNLSGKEIVGGYLVIALYRLRLLWVITFGLLPIVLISLAHGFVAMEIAFACLSYDILEGCVSPTPWEVLPQGLGLAAAITGIGAVMGIVLNWAAVCAALWSAFTFRKEGTAVGVSLGLALVLMLVYLGGSLVSINNLYPPGAAGAVIIGLTLVLAALGWGLLRLAARRA